MKNIVSVVVILLVVCHNIHAVPILSHFRLSLDPNLSLRMVISVPANDAGRVNIDRVTLSLWRRTSAEKLFQKFATFSLTEDIGEFRPVRQEQQTDNTWIIKDLTNEEDYSGFEYKAFAYVHYSRGNGIRHLEGTAFRSTPPKTLIEVEVIPDSVLRMKIKIVNSSTNNFDQLKITYQKSRGGQLLTANISTEQLASAAAEYTYDEVVETQVLQFHAVYRNVESLNPVLVQFNNTVPRITITNGTWNEKKQRLLVKYRVSRGDLQTVTLMMKSTQKNFIDASASYIVNYTSSGTLKIPYEDITSKGISSGLINLTATLDYDKRHSDISPEYLSSIPPLPPREVNYTYGEKLILTWVPPPREYDNTFIECVSNCLPPLKNVIKYNGGLESCEYTTKTGVVIDIRMHTERSIFKSQERQALLIIPVSNLISQTVIFSQNQSEGNVENGKFVLNIEAHGEAIAVFDNVEVNIYYPIEADSPLLSISFSNDRFQPLVRPESQNNTESGSLAEANASDAGYFAEKNTRSLLVTIDLDDYDLNKDHPIPGGTYLFHLQVKGVTEGKIIEEEVTTFPSPPESFDVAFSSLSEEIKFTWTFNPTHIQSSVHLSFCLDVEPFACHAEVLPATSTKKTIQAPSTTGAYTACLFTEHRGLQSACRYRKFTIDGKPVTASIAIGISAGLLLTAAVIFSVAVGCSAKRKARLVKTEEDDSRTVYQTHIVKEPSSQYEKLNKTQ